MDLYGELSCEQSLVCDLSPVASLQGDLSVGEIKKDPYYEVSNQSGTTIYIGS